MTTNRKIILPTELLLTARTMVLYHESHTRTAFDTIIQHAKHLVCPSEPYNIQRELEGFAECIKWCKKMKVTLRRPNQLKANAFVTILLMVLQRQIDSYTAVCQLELNKTHERKHRNAIFMPIMEGSQVGDLVVDVEPVRFQSPKVDLSVFANFDERRTVPVPPPLPPQRR